MECIDLSEHLPKQLRTVLSGEIIMHILWAGDIIIFSHIVDGLQGQP